ncbi:MAG: S8 family serine peptidase [Calditrichaeota bacterium]|nr:S8 family serine peptidase [Calditrichota bacterium]
MTPVKFLFCLLFLLITFLPSFSQTSPGDYYMVDGEKVMLNPSGNYQAVKMDADQISMDQVNAFSAKIDTSQIGQVEQSPLLAKYGIILIKLKKTISPQKVNSAMTQIKKMDNVKDENPVYSMDGIDQVLINEFAVQFKAEVTEADVSKILDQVKAEIVKKNEKIPNRYMIKFSGTAVREALQKTNELSSNPAVEFAEPNFIRIYPKRPKLQGSQNPSNQSVEPADTPNDPLYPNQWALNNTGSTGNADADIDAPEGWDLNTGSASIIIAIIDEGVDINHPDLQSKIVTPYDATDGDNDQFPNGWDGHGTSCAGIAAAITGNSIGVAGVARGCKILPVRIAYSNSDGGSWVTSNAIIEDGIRTAVDRGANVLSNSWGGGSASSLINSAVDYAISNNSTVVFAAGNNNGSVSYPANLSDTKTIISVSATNEWDQSKSPTSNDGENWWGTNFGPEVTVAAPGVHIYTTDISGSDGYAAGDYVTNFNGTSSATPIVAGVAALILSQNPGWTAAQVRTQLQNTADDLGTPGFDNRFGYGRVNVCNALGGACTYDGGDGDGGDGNGTCSSIGFGGGFGGSDSDQNYFNMFLLFSTFWLFLIYLLGRKIKQKYFA